MKTNRFVSIVGKVVLFASVATLSLVPTSTSASPIAPGFDLFTSNDNLGNSLGSEVDLNGFGLGIVPLKGLPFAYPGAPGPVDTIIQRIDGIDPFDPPDGIGTIDIELVALSLTSINPVDLTPLGGPFVGVFADLFTTVNKGGIIAGLPQPDILQPSIGRMEIRHEDGPLPTDDFGGTFDSIFGSPGDLNVPLALQGMLVPGGGVEANAIFTVVGGDPANPLDVFFSAVAPRLTIWSEDSTWRHVDGITDFQVLEIEDNCNIPQCHPVISVEKIIPEPAGLTLFALGGLMLARRRRQVR